MMVKGHRAGFRQIRVPHMDARQPTVALTQTRLTRKPPPAWTASWGPSRRSVSAHESQGETLFPASSGGEAQPPTPPLSPPKRGRKPKAVTLSNIPAASDAQPPPLPTSTRKRGRLPRAAKDAAQESGSGRRGSKAKHNEAQSPPAPHNKQPHRRLKWTPEASLALSQCFAEFVTSVKGRPEAWLGTSLKEGLVAAAAEYRELKGYSVDEILRKHANMYHFARLVRKEKEMEKEKVAPGFDQSVSDSEITAAAIMNLRKRLSKYFTTEIYRVWEPHVDSETSQMLQGLGKAGGVRGSVKALEGEGEGKQQQQQEQGAEKGRRRRKAPSDTMAFAAAGDGGKESLGSQLKAELEGGIQLVLVLSQIAAAIQRLADNSTEQLQLLKEKKRQSDGGESGKE